MRNYRKYPRLTCMVLFVFYLVLLQVSYGVAAPANLSCADMPNDSNVYSLSGSCCDQEGMTACSCSLTREGPVQAPVFPKNFTVSRAVDTVLPSGANFADSGLIAFQEVTLSSYQVFAGSSAIPIYLNNLSILR